MQSNSRHSSRQTKQLFEKNKSENQAVLLNKVNFYDDLVKIQTAFQTAKASIRANEAKGIRYNSRHWMKHIQEHIQGNRQGS